ncbi:MAG: hypothetical protein ABR505_02050 [Actinomycetota bacterium]
MPANGVADDLDLFTIGKDGASLQQLTSGPEADFNGVFSPDGSRVAFARATPFARAADIYVMNIDGSGLVNLTNTPLDDEYAPDWAPDGTRIAYTMATLTPLPAYIPLDTDTYLMNADGSDVVAVVQGAGHQAHPAWSPDGSWIAFHNSVTQAIELIRPDGSGRKVLARSSVGGQAFAPEWSPDGRWIAFSNGDIWIISLGGGRLRRLTETADREGFPAWSPDGTQIAFPAQGEGSSALYSLDLRRDRVRQLLGISLQSVVKPDWGRAS